MKKSVLIILFIGSILSSFAQYCNPTHGTTCDSWISGIDFANISSSGNGCSGGSSGYSDFTNQIANLEVLGNYALTVNLAGNYDFDGGYVWFDWNNNGLFEEAEMSLLNGTAPVGFFTIEIVVPPDAVVGVIGRFRIRTDFLSGVPDPCFEFGYGESEDYSFFIPNPNLPGCASNHAPNGTSECLNGVTLSWDPPTTGLPATAYDVYFGTGGTYTIINGVETTDTFMVVPTTLAPSTDYDWYVVPKNAEGSAQNCDTPVSFSTNPSQDPSLDLPDTEQTFCIGVPGDLGGLITNGNGDGSTWTYDWTPATPGLTDTDQDSAVFTASAPGDYRFFLSLADDSGCVAVDSMDIKVDPIPDVDIEGAVADFCFPTDYSLSITTTSSSIQWEAAGDNTNYVDLAGETAATLDVPYVNGLQYYRVRLVSGNCSFFSDTVSTTGTPAPATPQIQVVGANAENKFCQGDSAVLTVLNYADVNWVEAGITSESLTVKTAGTVTAIREEGMCASDTSIAFDINPLPVTPVLNFTSDAVKCPNEELALYPDVIQAGGVWSNGATTDTIYPSLVGVYSLEVTNEFGCQSTSNEVFVTLGADHDIPEINAPNGLEICGGTDLILEVTNHNSGITWDDDDQTNNKTLIVTRTGTYTATYTSSEGCTFVSESVTVTNAAGVEDPIITAGPENGLCEGEEVTLTVTNYDQGVWSDAASTNSKSLTVTSSGSYSVVCVAGNGCEATGSISLALSAKPDVPAIQLNEDDLVVNPNIATSFIWYFEGEEIVGENGALLSPTEEGNYAVRGVNGNCWGELSDSFFWKPIGINENARVQQIGVSPNPSSGVFAVSGLDEGTECQVLDNQGRVVRLWVYSKSNQQIDLSDLESGLYYLTNKNRLHHHAKMVVVH